MENSSSKKFLPTGVDEKEIFRGGEIWVSHIDNAEVIEPAHDYSQPFTESPKN